MSLAIRNGKIFIAGELVEADILCENGKISRIAKSTEGDETLDASGLTVLPGVIDAHVHFRTPGMEQKEDWTTGSRSAAKGGVTSVFDMPNTFPPTTTASLLEEKRKRVRGKSLVNYGFYLGATKNNTEEIIKAKNIPGVKVYMASTTGNLLVEDEESIKRVFEAAKKGGKLAVCHAEEEELLKKALEEARSLDPEDSLLHCKTRPKQCAVEGVKKACRIAKGVGNRLHITHATTGEETLIAKDCGATCDTTTSYLFLEEKDLERLGNYAKMNPPVRSHEDRMELWKQLKAGKIDLITTDHAPHTREEKDKSYWDAPGGVPGVQTLVPLLLNEVNRKNISIEEFVKLTSLNPALIMRAKSKGMIVEGMDADLTIVDMKLERTLTDEEIESKCGWTPYAGRKLKGWPVMTVVKGQLAWHDGGFGEPNGEEVRYAD